MTSPLRRTEAVLQDVPRPLRPIVWLVAALVTPFWMLADLARRTGSLIPKILYALSWPFRVLGPPLIALWNGLLAVLGALGAAVGWVLHLVAVLFRLIFRGVTAVLAACTWLWTRLLEPVVRAVGTVLRALGAAVCWLLRVLGVPARFLAAALAWTGRVLATGARFLGAALLAIGHALAVPLRPLGRGLARLWLGLIWLGWGLTTALLVLGRLLARVWRWLAAAGGWLIRMALATGRAARFLAEQAWRPFRWLWRRVLVPSGRAIGRATREIGRAVRAVGRPVLAGVAALRRRGREAISPVREAVRALRRR